ncbi:MAG: hypothetical protein BWY72_02438 [Bacteroidetes bacterium ADurb.Bin416]|nr:MAG: hypothetical protein BWY72_02438 [Bacteroidetes bacterium ADurb.Bin416]
MHFPLSAIYNLTINLRYGETRIFSLLSANY